MTVSRRQFLTAAVTGATAPVWLRLSGLIDDTPAFAASPNGSRLLLVVFLQGGNDGLNTVVPYLDSNYQRLRPNVAIRPSEVLELGAGLGLHPALSYVHSQWHQGRLAIVQGVGYPQPDFSHFASTAVWETASRDGRFLNGWLGRYLDATEGRATGPIRAFAIAPDMPVTLSGDRVSGVAARSVPGFGFHDAGQAAIRRHEALRQLGEAQRGAGARVVVARHQLAMIDAIDAVRRVAKNMPSSMTAAETLVEAFAGGLGTEVGFIALGAFDTHTNQRARHTSRLKAVDDTLRSFFAAAQRRGVSDRVSAMVFSEFGRRVPENGSGGTDHGAAGPVFLLGPTVRGGLYGDRPDLSRLVDGNMMPGIDLRQVYATILEQHLAAPSSPVLGARFGQLPLFSSRR